MNRCRNLRTLRRALDWRLSRLERRLGPLVAAPSRDRDLVVSYVAIESLNAWTLFSKSFYLSCALNAVTERKRTIGVVPVGLTKNDAVGLAVRRFRPLARPNSIGAWDRHDEPTWHDPNVLMAVCRHLRCSVQAQVESAFSLGQSVFIHLP